MCRRTLQDGIARSATQRSENGRPNKYVALRWICNVLALSERASAGGPQAPPPYRRAIVRCAHYANSLAYPCWTFKDLQNVLGDDARISGSSVICRVRVSWLQGTARSMRTRMLNNLMTGNGTVEHCLLTRTRQRYSVALRSVRTPTATTTRFNTNRTNSMFHCCVQSILARGSPTRVPQAVYKSTQWAAKRAHLDFWNVFSAAPSMDTPKHSG